MKPWTRDDIRAVLDSPRWYGRTPVQAEQPSGMQLTEEDFRRATEAWGKYCGNSTADEHRVICRRMREGKSASGWYPRKTVTGCGIEGCGREPYAKGMCHTHYERTRIGLPVDMPIIARKRHAA